MIFDGDSDFRCLPVSNTAQEWVPWLGGHRTRCNMRDLADEAIRQHANRQCQPNVQTHEQHNIPKRVAFGRCSATWKKIWSTQKNNSSYMVSAYVVLLPYQRYQHQHFLARRRAARNAPQPKLALWYQFSIDGVLTDGRGTIRLAFRKVSAKGVRQKCLQFIPEHCRH